MKKVIIIGAGRSGTNILRDVLSSIDGIETWPCDEINYIWRHGNIKLETDEFTPKDATPKVKKYIIGAFQKFQKRSKADIVLEKTCANSLRVGFVNEIFPDAKFIHIIRDGRDVVNSAKKRWKAELDIKYILEKARYVPLIDFPYYATKYFINRVHLLFSKEGRLSFWGPKFNGMNEILKSSTLVEVCAHQWKSCVERASADFERLDSKNLIEISYEELVADTEKVIKELCDFIGLKVSSEQISVLSGMVHKESAGKWAKQMTNEEIELVHNIIEPTLINLGYSSNQGSVK